MVLTGPEWPLLVASDGRDVRRSLGRPAPAPSEFFRFYPRSFAYAVSDEGNGTDVHMYGTDLRGRTVAVRATGFRPYLFLRWPKGQGNVVLFLEQLDLLLCALASQYPNGSIGTPVRRAITRTSARPILGCEMVDAVAMKACGEDRGFNGQRTDSFLQVFVYSPSLVPVIRTILEHVNDHFLLSSGTVHRSGEEVATEIYASVTKKWGGDEKETGDGGKKRKQPDAHTNAGKLRAAGESSKPLVEEEEGGNPWDDLGVTLGAALEEEPEGPAEKIEFILSERVRKWLGDFDDNGGWEKLLVGGRAPEVYEGNVDFVVRFTIDAGFAAEECVEIRCPEAGWQPFLVGEDGVPLRDGSDVSLSVDWQRISRVEERALQDALPPQVGLSFDCETETGPGGAFPRPQTERMLQICCFAFDPASDPGCARGVRRAFTLGEVRLADDASWKSDEVFSFDSEMLLLKAVACWMGALKPDFITGWNIENFDLWYLVERAKALGDTDAFSCLCRKPGAALRIADRSFHSTAHGTHLYKEVTGEGLWVWDLYQAFKRSTSFKLRSFKLDYVATKFLKERKEDVAYSAINGLQQTPEGRFRLMKYCMKDAVLPARLIGKLGLLHMNVELARATGIPIDMVCRRGLQIRIRSMLYRVAKNMPIRHVFYTRTAADRRQRADKYEGAYVFDPLLGYHDVPVVTLDFKSLYPSIMRTKNMCLLTLVPGRSRLERQGEFSLTEEQLWRAERNVLPGGPEDQPSFVRHERLAGLVPVVISDLLSRRSQAKKAMERAEEAGDAAAAALLNVRQTVIKLNTNSIYGFFGAESSEAFSQEIAASVTSTGRDMILETARLVEQKFTRANGYPYDAKIVAGDTDSVFVRMSADVNIQDSAKYGVEMAQYVTLHFRQKYGQRPENIVELDFEKTFSRMLIYAKKRYCGWKWELKLNKKTGKKEMMRKDEPSMSGMETERRDSCLLVSDGVRDILAILLGEGGRGSESVVRVQRYIWDRMILPFQRGTLPWNLLVQSKQFRMRPAEYRAKGQTPPIHIQLAERLEKRLGAGADGTYRPGDRIQFVVVEGAEPGMKTSECGEDPDHAWTHRMTLSHAHYVENAIKGTMVRILEPVLMPADHASINAARDVSRMFETFFREGAAGSTFVAVPIQPDVSAMLREEKGKLQGVVKEKRCAGCKVPTKLELLDTHGLCPHHGEAERAARALIVGSVVSAAREARARLWKTCQGCTRGFDPEKEPGRAREIPPLPDLESLETLTPCKNNECAVYWERRCNDRMLGK